MKEGVFWVLENSSKKIEKGDFRFLSYFDSNKGHAEVWQRIKCENAELSNFDFEHFPRGRVWGKEQNAIIFIDRRIKFPTVIQRIKEEFEIEEKYIVYEDQ